MNVEETVKAIVAEVCGVAVSEVNLDSAIGDFPQWDSMGQMLILQKTEEACNVSFEPEEMMDIEDVKDIVAAVEKQK